MAEPVSTDIHSTYADTHIPKEPPKGKYLWIFPIFIPNQDMLLNKKVIISSFKQLFDLNR